MKKFLVALLTLALCFAIVGCNPVDPTPTPSGSTTPTPSTGSGSPIVGLICLHGQSSTYDKNFIDAFVAACEAKGLSEDEYVIVVDIPEGQECYDEAVNMAEAGVKAIFADSFGHESYMLQAAEEYPDVTFCHATGTMAHTEELDNFHNAFAAIYEGRFLAGIAAGLKIAEMVEDGTIPAAEINNIHVGYVGAFPYEEVKSGYTSWFLGVRMGIMYSATPDTVSTMMGIFNTIQMDVEFTNSWYDQTLEYNAAAKLINEGCVLISQHADSMGAPSACEEAGVPNVAYNGSTAAQCPETFIVSSRINWQPYFEKMIDVALTGDDNLPTDYVGTIADGSVVLTALGEAAAEGTAEAIEYWTDMLALGFEVYDVSYFTVGGLAVTEYMANVDTDPGFEADTNVVKTKTIEIDGDEMSITYIAESFFRSAPYFGLDIDGINPRYPDAN